MNTLITFPYDTFVFLDSPPEHVNSFWPDMLLLTIISFYMWVIALDGWFRLMVLFFQYGWSAIISSFLISLFLFFSLIILQRKKEEL